MVWYPLLLVLWATAVRGNSTYQYTGSFTVNIPVSKLESFMEKMEALTDVIQTMKTEQENMKRDQDDLRQEQIDLKNHILKRLDAIDEKTERSLENCKQGVNPRKNGATTTERPVSGFKDCQELYNQGNRSSGVYWIYPDGSRRVQVYCEQELDGGGWTIFQSREDGSMDFYRDWADYKAGFGNLSGEFWLGNDNIHLLTKDHGQKLKIELKYHTETAYADYSSFWIDDESEKYKLNVSGFSGANPPGDSLRYHNGSPFSTRDRDHDTSPITCAIGYHGAWWYKSCHHSNLNGYYGGRAPGNGLNWSTWKDYKVSLTGTRMMVKGKE